MVRIRLMKPGKSVKGRCHYKIVVMESTKPRDSNFIAQVGFYDPSRKILEVDLAKYEVWAKKGAKSTETVASLVKRYKKFLKKTTLPVFKSSNAVCNLSAIDFSPSLSQTRGSYFFLFGTSSPSGFPIWPCRYSLFSS